MSARVALLLAVAALTPACGYHIIRPDVGSGRTILVPTPVNETGWPGIESDLAADLRSDVQRQLDLQLSTQRPDFVLDTQISEVGRSARVGLRSGGAALGTTRVQVNWTLRDPDAPDDEPIARGRIIRELEFLTALDEDPYTTFPDLMAKISEQIVLEVGAGLFEVVTAP